MIYKSLSISANNPLPDSIGLFVNNKGFQPAYIVGYGFKSKIKCSGCASESYDGKIDKLEPSMGGVVEIQLNAVILDYICSGLSRGNLFGWLLRNGILVNFSASYLSRKLIFFIITSDSKKHCIKSTPKAFMSTLKEYLIKSFDKKSPS